jgi:predicted enzyme related to lactoylglutathione lyase
VIQNITVDCHDLEAMAEFWATTTGFQRTSTDDRYAVLVHPTATYPRLLMQKVSEPKTAKNRVHLDLGAEDRQAEVKRLVALGAREAETITEYDVTWTVMADPEENEFCVVAVRA